ncbi:MAG: hypothetical protein IPL47_01545 [Phyllobacteriaceae bacterium]|nr:hypothetical protein [Phyllobacteriaceae bacterium]
MHKPNRLDSQRRGDSSKVPKLLIEFREGDEVDPTTIFDKPIEDLEKVQLRKYFSWFSQSAFKKTEVTFGETLGSLIGQFAISEIEIRERKCGQFFHFGICKKHRNISNIIAFYKQSENKVKENKYNYIIAVPNKKSFLLNKRFLKMEDRLTLDIRVGVALPRTSRRIVVSRAVDRADPFDATRWIAGHLAPSECAEVVWDAETLAGRLGNPMQSYALHATKDLALISSPRFFRGIPVVLLCSFHALPSEHVAPADVGALVAAAARFHRNPLFLYVGVNKALPRLPGWPIPDRWRPSRMIVQVREMVPDAPRLELDRFESIDFDFA